MKKALFLAIILLALAASASAQMVGSTNSQRAPRQSGSESPLFHPTGSSLKFSAGYPHFFTAAYNYHLTSGLMVGGGAGIGIYGRQSEKKRYYKPAYSYTYSFDNSWTNYDFEHLGMPVFVEAELHTPKFKWSLFLNAKFGYNFFRREDYTTMGDRYYSDWRWSYSDYDDYYTYDRFFLIVSAGLRYKNYGIGGGVYLSQGTTFCAYLSYDIPATTTLGSLFFL